MASSSSSASASTSPASSWSVASALRSIDGSRPPVKSARIASSRAAARCCGVHSPRSCAAISSVLHVRTPAASTAATMPSLWPISPVPRTHPMSACARVVRAPHDSSAPQRVTSASSAALDSP
ncbi:Uncharacterised protein [Mycobacteroides abscessus subsp. abscessus]|nr:Uncharacterised protein [Mycobacteroides abscessus subsp. abscessus]